MTTQTEKAKAKLAVLSTSFDDLEALLDPLFAQTLPETVLSLEPLQQAKLQTVLPYLAYDLVFIYLKSRGIDPKTHPVVTELDRVKQYFQKISNAENSPTKRTEIDTAAAQRFIKHAIAQASSSKPTTDLTSGTADHPPPAAVYPPPHLVPVKVTSKMLHRQQYHQQLKEQHTRPEEEEGEEDSLRIIDGESDNSSDSDIAQHEPKKTPELSSLVPAPINTKRKRPTVDPFAGYGDQPLSTIIPSSSSTDRLNTAGDASLTVATQKPQLKKSKVQNSVGAKKAKKTKTPST